jgi:hypothetical protein
VQIKKLLLSKGNNYQNQETGYRMGENLGSSSSGKGLTFRIYKGLKTLNIKRTKFG